VPSPGRPFRAKGAFENQDGSTAWRGLQDASLERCWLVEALAHSSTRSCWNSSDIHGHTTALSPVRLHGPHRHTRPLTWDCGTTMYLLKGTTYFTLAESISSLTRGAMDRVVKSHYYCRCRGRSVFLSRCATLLPSSLDQSPRRGALAPAISGAKIPGAINQCATHSPLFWNPNLCLLFHTWSPVRGQHPGW
jgi:hypothetical protein